MVDAKKKRYKAKKSKEKAKKKKGKKKKDTRKKQKRYKARSKKVRKKQKIVKILAYVKKSSNFVAVKVYKIIKENKLWKHQLN